MRVELPVALDHESEPEPDVAGEPGDFWDAHPSRPALVVEVAETSLPAGRGPKASLYARGGVMDYWIVNLADQTLEVHRGPAPDAPDTYYGWRYSQVQRLRPGEAVTPLAAGAVVRIADLFRPARR